MLLIVCVTDSGAAEPKAQLVGIWELDLDDYVAQRTQTVSPEKAKEFRHALTNQGFRLGFDFRADGTVIFTKILDKDIPGEYSGVWKITRVDVDQFVIEMKPDDKDVSESMTVKFVEKDQLRVVEPRKNVALFRRVKSSKSN